MTLSRLSRRALAGCLCAAGWILASLTPAVAVVHAGDELQVTVFNQPGLTRRVVVSADESLSLPLAGAIDVHGLDTPQIAERIRHALEQYLKKPAVDVEVTAHAPTLFVSGGPGGILKYQPGETLAGALSELPDKGSGMMHLERTRIDLHHVGIVRNGSSLGTFDAIALSARGDGGPALLPGDTIELVDKPNAVRVLGAVKRPGTMFLTSDETLSDALDQAGGIETTAATARILLQRGTLTHSLALGDAQFRDLAQDGDVITVPTAPRVSVIGLVDKPGTVDLKTDFTLLNAIYQAGGPSKRADITHVAVVRNGSTTVYDVGALTHGSMAQNPTLQDGDLVLVPEGHRLDALPIFQSLLPFLYLVR